jgi:iron complex outermembrane receptor protein
MSIASGAAGARMKKPRLIRHLALCAGLALVRSAYAAPDPAAGDPAAAVPVIVVSGSRSAHDSFDLPAAISVIDAAQIGADQPRVNASEALVAVPGLVVQNRQNYAQDLQISSRGFGARSAFGVRGVKLIADGIPATMPDGQGQAATFDLDMAERIEVLRGPYSAIYGNHSGGVIQMFTRDGEGAPSIDSTITAGSYGSKKADVNAQGSSDGIGYVLDASRFDTDGYREHSAARRDQAYAKLTLHPWPDGKLTIVANSLNSDADDPLGATWASVEANPRAGQIDTTDTANPKRTLADRYDTRKSIDHKQAGVTYEQHVGDDLLHVTVYGGNRNVDQYQAFSKALQAPSSNSGGVIDFQRNFYGTDINWRHVTPFAGGKLTATAGIEYGRSEDDRQGYNNYIGDTYGVQGALRRDENDIVSTLDPYLQGEWDLGRWQFTAGVRYSHMQVEVVDHFLSNGNDSGSLRYTNTTPLLGALYKLTPSLNLYASAARGFETPTLNELFYSGSGGGFNFNLAPAHSTHLEVGAKALLGPDTRAELALFQVRTTDELVVDVSTGGRTSYRNAGKTLRQGAELSIDTSWAYGFSTRLAATELRAVYDSAFTGVLEGSRLPGVPNANLFAELAWKDAAGRFGAAMEAVASSKIYADDANADTPAPGYGILNLRVDAKQQVGNWRLKQFARLNNLLDRQYVGSVIVDDSNKRYYEAAPGRNWLLGLSARYTF